MARPPLAVTFGNPGEDPVPGEPIKSHLPRGGKHAAFIRQLIEEDDVAVPRVWSRAVDQLASVGRRAGEYLCRYRKSHAVELGDALIAASAVKWFSVWIGARLVGEDNRSATNLAIAMNARGGPGIVIASTTFAAGIISEVFFTALVILAILTSQIAGIWLGAAKARGHFAPPADEPRTRTTGETVHAVRRGS